jgi:hypothetical protein
MNQSCGCCQGIQRRTPERIVSRPGLAMIPYRVGRHATFLETMLARLANFAIEIRPNGASAGGANFDGGDFHNRDSAGGDSAPVQGAQADQPQWIYPLRGLTTRASDDPSIALLDAWAVLGDVLAFYQERIANEGYLRTAVERRSILELARLVGYTLRPGVASTVYLAYTIESTATEPVTIPAGARVQSIPGPGELPQPFESVEEFEARAAWNLLQPRLSRPQTRQSILQPFLGDYRQAGVARIFLQGTATNLKINDPLLVDFSEGSPRLFRVVEVIPDSAAERTTVLLRAWREAAGARQAETLIAEVYALIHRYRTDEVRRLALRTTTVSYNKANTALQALEARMGAGATAGEQFEWLRAETMPLLERELRNAEERGYTDLAPWLGGLLAGLNRISAATPSAEVHELAVEAPARNGGGKHRGGLADTLAELVKPPSLPPRSGLALDRRLEQLFDPRADANLQVVNALTPAARGELRTLLANSKVSRSVPIKVYALRVKASLFGHNAARQPVFLDSTDSTDLYTLTGPPNVTNIWWSSVDDDNMPQVEDDEMPLDAVYDPILPGSYLAVDSPAFTNEDRKTVFTVRSNQTRSMEALSMATKVSVLALDDPQWMTNAWPDVGDLEARPSFLRSTNVYTGSEELALAEEPIEDPICGTDQDGAANALIELGGVYSGLQAGRWLIVSGERTDVRTPDPDDPSRTLPVPGLHSSELVMLAEVIQQVAEQAQGEGEQDSLPGERYRTYIRLASGLEYCYRRDTVKIYGNVVKATHGETRSETLGSGDGSKAFQTYTLKQPPLTFVSAPTPAGAESTLRVRVNEIAWREVDNLAFLAANERGYITRTDEEGKTSVIFGNGRQGARPPTGAENIRAVYRSAIGKPGNVRDEQISLLVTRPLGVKEVINPIRASGGADRESRDRARQNAPEAVLALDRLVSTQDYADFSRTFAGVAKASAARLSSGREPFVLVTIAGEDDIPIDASSDLYQNLRKALKQNGDPHLPLRLMVRELLLLVISANVRAAPEYRWEAVVEEIRASLLDAFSFQKRELGQDVVLSEVTAAIQAVPGVEYVDVDLLGGIAELSENNRLRTPKQIGADVQQMIAESQQNGPAGRVAANLAWVETIYNPTYDRVRHVNHPAQIAFLAPDVPATLVINEIRG